MTVGGKAVAASKSCTVETNCETKEAGMSGTGSWKRYITGRKSWQVSVSYRKSWQVSVSYLVGDSATIKSLLGKVGTTVSLSWKMRDDEADTMSGDAILTSCKISGTRGNLVQGSFSFKGTGELK